MSGWKALSIVLVLAFAGCGGRSVRTERVTPAPPPTAKATLEEVAKSGSPLGSGAEALRQELEKLKATDAAKAEKLLKQLDELSTLTDPARIKAKASEMASQL